MPSQGFMLLWLLGAMAVMAIGSGIALLFSSFMKRLGFKEVPDEQDKK